MKKGIAIFLGWLFPFVYCVAGVDAYLVFTGLWLFRHRKLPIRIALVLWRGGVPGIHPTLLESVLTFWDKNLLIGKPEVRSGIRPDAENKGLTADCLVSSSEIDQTSGSCWFYTLGRDWPACVLAPTCMDTWDRVALPYNRAPWTSFSITSPILDFLIISE